MRGYQPRIGSGRNRGNPGIEMVYRYTVPSGIQQYGIEPAPVVCGFREGSHREREELIIDS